MRLYLIQPHYVHYVIILSETRRISTSKKYESRSMEYFL